MSPAAACSPGLITSPQGNDSRPAVYARWRSGDSGAAPRLRYRARRGGRQPAARQICEIDADFYVEDLKSRNGTFVNGEQIRGRHGLRTTTASRFATCSSPFIAVSSMPNPAASIRPWPKWWTTSGHDRLDHDVKLDVAKASRVATILGQCRSEAQGADRDQQQPGHDHLGRSVLPKVLDSLFRVFLQADRGFIVLQKRAERAAGAQGREAPRPGDEEHDPHQPDDRRPGDAGEGSDPLGRRGQRHALRFEPEHRRLSHSLGDVRRWSKHGPGWA